jgi:hypothetical protein
MHMSDDSIGRVDPDPSVPGSIVYELLVDTRGNTWFGTDGGGVIRFDGSQYTSFTKDDGLVGDRVYALAEDSIGCIWVGTSAGLSQLDGMRFTNLKYGQGFGEIGLHGLTVDRDGYLWVSSFPGITKVKPQKFYKSSRPPPVYIVKMQVDTLSFGTEESIELDPDAAVIVFRYAGLSFTDEASVRYKYKLDGFDKDWSPPVRTREVRYTHLAGGNYTFSVLARSADGVWSSDPAVISFSILPPVWARWWFVTGSLLIVCAAVYALYRYRLEKAVQLERTRSRIAMDLHDDIGSSLTKISVLSEVARRQGADQLPVRSDVLTRIGDTARELIDQLGDIVWAVDPKQDDLQNVIRRIVQFGQEMCEGRGIEYETEIAAEFSDAKLALERRRDVFLVFKEATNNAVKHSGATRVRFCVAHTGDGALLELYDNGTGFVEHPGQSGNGLISMRTRGGRLGGRFILTSSSGKGTTVSLELKTG